MCSLGEVCTPRSLLLFYYSTLGAICQGFFATFFIFLPSSAEVLCSTLVPLSPWYILSIPHLKEKVNSYLVKSCTNYGIFCGRNLFNLPIDKIAGVWYNGKFGSWQPITSRQKERGGDFSPPIYHFISAKIFCNLSISASSFTHSSPISSNSPYTQVPTS